MNERVMQFRIGMFAIVAGLVLTMLIIWFGESPALLRDQVFVIVHFTEAPGVSEGIPVRKSGIRVGEVTAIAFDERPKHPGRLIGILDKEGMVLIDLGPKGQGVAPLDQFQGKNPVVGQAVEVVINRLDSATNRLQLALPDGVLVTLALEKKARIKAGSVPRISRALIGDVSINLVPGTGPGPLTASETAARAPVIEGSVSPDPSYALAAATAAFEKVGGTLKSIEAAANGLAAVTKKAENVDELIVSFRDMGKHVGTLSEDVDRVIRANEADIKPAIANLRQVAEKVNGTLDPQTQANVQTAADHLATASAKLDRILVDLEPVAKEIGADPATNPRTNLGQVLFRVNRIAFEVGLLTSKLNDGRGQLNEKGSIQQLIVDSQLYDNFNQMAISARTAFDGARPALRSFSVFADKIARDPSAISRGALQAR
jgi:phospholipid/cholesterol/gamma-HCH transport system substrate-binding protein